MKKTLALVLIALLVVGAAIAFTGCSSSAGDLKLGFASKTTLSVKPLAAAEDGTQSATIQADTMMISALVDKDGKVQKINIDIVQSPVKYDQTGAVISPTDLTAAVPTKKEKGDAYGMKKASKIGKEWFEQAAAIEKWMTGKTADQIKNMKIQKGPEGDNIAAETDLTSSATIGIDEFIEVAVAAVNNAK